MPKKRSLEQWLDEFEAALGLDGGSDRPELAAELAPNLAIWAQPLMQPNRYKCLYGGRGSGKSYAAADALLIEGTEAQNPRPVRS
jgi:hypothetical protein